MDEAALIAAARARDEKSEEAFAELYRRHLSHVRAIGYSILRTSDLDDLCQETFLLAFTRLDSFKGGSTFRTWITRIALNRCYMLLRRQRQPTNGADCLVSLDACLSGVPYREAGPTTDAGSGEVRLPTGEDANLRAAIARVDLEKLLHGLKPKNRRILEMSYLEGLSDREIAARTGLSLSAVKGRLYQARGKARRGGERRERRMRLLSPNRIE